MDVFKASERRAAGAYEGRLGMLQRDQDAKVLAPMDAVLRRAKTGQGSAERYCMKIALDPAELSSLEDSCPPPGHF